MDKTFSKDIWSSSLLLVGMLNDPKSLEDALKTSTDLDDLSHCFSHVCFKNHPPCVEIFFNHLQNQTLDFDISHGLQTCFLNNRMDLIEKIQKITPLNQQHWLHGVRCSALAGQPQVLEYALKQLDNSSVLPVYRLLDLCVDNTQTSARNMLQCIKLLEPYINTLEFFIY